MSEDKLLNISVRSESRTMALARTRYEDDSDTRSNSIIYPTTATVTHTVSELQWAVRAVAAEVKLSERERHHGEMMDILLRIIVSILLVHGNRRLRTDIAPQVRTARILGRHFGDRSLRRLGWTGRLSCSSKGYLASALYDPNLIPLHLYCECFSTGSASQCEADERELIGGT